MKILHLSAYAHRGGCEKNCYHFINGSPQFTHELIVLGEEGPMSEDWAKLPLQIQHLHIVNKGMMAFRKGLKNHLKQKKFDLVICWSTIRLPLQLNCLNNVTQDVRVYLGNPLGHNPIKDAVLNIFFKYKGKTVLMGCSDYVSLTYKTVPYFKNFSVKTSLNPIALPSQFPQKNIDPGKFKLGMVARLDPIKDHATVIKAFALIIKEIHVAELHFVGEGVLRETLEQMAVIEKVQNKVFFHGDVKNVYDYLNEWDVFVYATTPSEGLGSVVGEAMANGLPCVLCDLPMLRELAPKDGLAIFFEAGNVSALSEKIRTLFKDESLQKKLSKAVFNHAQANFGIERFVKDYL